MATATGARIPKLGGRGFIGQMKNWMAGWKRNTEADGIKTTLWKCVPLSPPELLASEIPNFIHINSFSICRVCLDTWSPSPRL